MRAIAALGLSLLLGCGGPRLFALRAPMTRDRDEHPFPDKPAEQFSGLYWDGADQMIFRPMARFWAIDPGRESVDVNALDEVPDSSWFENRIGVADLSPDDVARGPCRTPPPEDGGPWTVVRGKPGGDNPGFVARGPDGRKYVVKLDVEGHVRATAADVIASRLYWAAGYLVPCNRIVFIDPAQLLIAPGSEYETNTGQKRPLTRKVLDDNLAKAEFGPHGWVRALASLYLDGEPLGPFRYEGTRGDDPNDVVPHEDRRELRASRLMAAWTGHTDARESNTLDMWVRAPGGGFVSHHLIDFGDCFGSLWEPPMLGRRLGHSAYFDFDDLFSDWFTFGAIRRPWEDERFGPSGRVLGYYDLELFDPEHWVPGYPNPAMLRMTERDAAWMARIMSRFSREHIEAAIGQGRIGDPLLGGELLRILDGRRRSILVRYLARVSPLTAPQVQWRQRAEMRSAELCLTDRAATAGLGDLPQNRDDARGWLARPRRALPLGPPRRDRGGHVCVPLPVEHGASFAQPRYAIVDLVAAPETQAPARVHLVAVGPLDWRVVGLERPEK